MRFSVPKFIEHEAKIVGPLTFRQFVYVGIAGAICFLAYFTIGQQNPFLVLLISAILMGGAFALAFVRVGGRTLPTVIGNFLKFNLAPKIFIWRKLQVPIQIFKKEVVIEEKKDEELPLKIAEKSQLKKLRTDIETKTK